MESLEKKIECIFETQIDDYFLDLVNRKITMNLTNRDTGEKHRVIIFGISVFAFADLEGEKYDENTFLELEKGGYFLEISDYALLSDTRIHVVNSKNKAWSSQFDMKVDLLLEIWGNDLLIKATGIIIDNNKYFFSEQ